MPKGTLAVSAGLAIIILVVTSIFVTVNSEKTTEPTKLIVFCTASNEALHNQNFPPPAPEYDQQITVAFAQGSYISLEYNVTAISQNDTFGYGPAYLMNGLTDNGYWYQFGIEYNWPGSSNSGFGLVYDVWNQYGQNIISSLGSTSTTCSMSMRNGDIIEISLKLSDQKAEMFAYDWNTTANATATYDSERASDFVTVSNSVSSSRGYLTGLMFEWYHPCEPLLKEKSVNFSSSEISVSRAWICITELKRGNALFQYCGSSPYNLGYANQDFAYNGSMLLIANNHDFVEF